MQLPTLAGEGSRRKQRRSGESPQGQGPPVRSALNTVASGYRDLLDIIATRITIAPSATTITTAQITKDIQANIRTSPPDDFLESSYPRSRSARLHLRLAYSTIRHSIGRHHADWGCRLVTSSHRLDDGAPLGSGVVHA